MKILRQQDCFLDWNSNFLILLQEIKKDKKYKVSKLWDEKHEHLDREEEFNSDFLGTSVREVALDRYRQLTNEIVLKVTN